MEDNFSKYLKLTGSILLSLLVFIIVLILIMLGVRLFFGILNYIPWVNYIFLLFIISVPSAIFITAFLIFYIRTKSHPSKPVKIISRIFIICVLLTWLVVYITDLVTMLRHGYEDIGMYNSFNMLFLFVNVALLFFLGVLQALTTAKEKDWHERAQH